MEALLKQKVFNIEDLFVYDTFVYYHTEQHNAIITTHHCVDLHISQWYVNKRSVGVWCIMVDWGMLVVSLIGVQACDAF